MSKVNFKRMLHGFKHFIKTNKNDILFGAGVVTEVAAVVATGKAVLKTKFMADENAELIEQYQDKDDSTEEEKQYNAEQRRVIYRHVTGQVIKNYALPTGLTLLSIGFYGKSHFNLKKELTATTAALAAEHALNQRLLAERNAKSQSDISENKAEDNTETNAPYSAGDPSDSDKMFLKRGVIVYDSDTKYFAETEGYAEPTGIFLSPTVIDFHKDKYSRWECNWDWNIAQVKRWMRDISREICLYGFVNLNEAREFFSTGRSYKLEEAENYYLVFDENRKEDDQVWYRIYADCDENGRIDEEHIYIDIFNTIVPKAGRLKEAKRQAIAANPFKET